MDFIKLGNKIKSARENKKLTQAEVAKKIGLNTNYYAVIERGEVKTSLENIEKICKALGIKLTLG
jgi:transcriptional regulator with XRE-family HTH domain